MSLIYRLLLLQCYAVLAATWLRLIVTGPRPGLLRLCLCVPVLISNFLALSLFQAREEITTFVLVFITHAWCGSFKALSMALNRGALIRPLTFIQFCTVYALPFTLQEESAGGMDSANDPSSEAGRGLLKRCAIKAALVIAEAFLIEHVTNLVAVECLYVFGLYLFMGAVMDACAYLASWLTGLRIAPHFDRPYLSTSQSDWWGRRWNLTVGSCLRSLVLDPILEGRLIADPKVACLKASKTKRLLAAHATFFVSGIMHELLMWHMRGKVTWYWLAYFSVQGPVVAAEFELRRIANAWGIKLPFPLDVIFALGCTTAVGHVLFFPPCHEVELPQKVVSNIQEGVQEALAGFLSLLRIA